MESLSHSALLVLLYETALVSTNYRIIQMPDGKERKQIWFNGNYWLESVLRERLDRARAKIEAEAAREPSNSSDAEEE